jgi:hypothetical protein
MTTLRRMVADHTVQLALYDGHWTVSPCPPDGASAWNLDCDELDDAIGATRSFAWVLQDDMPIDDSQMEAHRIEVRQVLQEARDRMVAGEEIATERDTDLRAWFTREMEGE